MRFSLSGSLDPIMSALAEARIDQRVARGQRRVDATAAVLVELIERRQVKLRTADLRYGPEDLESLPAEGDSPA